MAQSTFFQSYWDGSSCVESALHYKCENEELNFIFQPPLCDEDNGHR